MPLRQAGPGQQKQQQPPQQAMIMPHAMMMPQVIDLPSRRRKTKRAVIAWICAGRFVGKVHRGACELSRGVRSIYVSASGEWSATATRDPKSLPRPRALTCDGHSEGGPNTCDYVCWPLRNGVGRETAAARRCSALAGVLETQPESPARCRRI